MLVQRWCRNGGGCVGCVVVGATVVVFLTWPLFCLFVFDLFVFSQWCVVHHCFGNDRTTHGRDPVSIGVFVDDFESSAIRQ